MPSSKKSALNDEPENKGTMYTFVIHQLDKFFTDHIPVDSLKELPSTCKSFLKSFPSAF